MRNRRFAAKDDRRTRKPEEHNPRQQAHDDGPSLIYGVSPVLESLRAEGRKIDKVMIAEGSKEARLSEIIDICRERSIPWTRSPRETFTKLIGTGVNHQGVAAFSASAAYADVDSIIGQTDRPSLIVILDGVEDPRNLGAILRVAEGAAADGVIIPERRAVGLTETVAKASAGAIEYVKVAKTSNLNRLIEKLKDKNIWVVGTGADAAM
ncbi:MAG: TrmH family RNA methyltransferase, partial [Pyrinomonadaceae bacterium]